ncbi:hypothetical protein [Mesorhizobium erdmanii]|uniref:hypothetical protein n=1 Tax=Mesorhizobium erdmanii TaxID=1777866 RepID=UPI00047B915E|nr:hypothetical protein [Mesorhizobium erdmanii]
MSDEPVVEAPACAPVAIGALATVATWRPARAVGDRDINSFGLKLDATASQQGRQPCMSIWLTADR